LARRGLRRDVQSNVQSGFCREVDEGVEAEVLDSSAQQIV